MGPGFSRSHAGATAFFQLFRLVSIAYHLVPRLCLGTLYTEALPHKQEAAPCNKSKVAANAFQGAYPNRLGNTGLSMHKIVEIERAKDNPERVNPEPQNACHIKDLDLLKIPLSGNILIEAGAGTGKTYAISCLYLRLILEKGLSVQEILVVTFTKAATEELKDRIRKRLRQCIDAFERGCHEDPFLDFLIKQYDNPSRPVESLKAELRDFDEAAIFTIHGFCRRMLFENAFETGCPFDTELVTNMDVFVRETAHDFWRIHTYKASPELIYYLLKAGISSESITKRLQRGLVHPGLRIIPKVEPVKPDGLEPFRKEFKTLKNAWPDMRDEVREKLMHARLKGGTYGTTKPLPNGTSRRGLKISQFFNEMDRFVSFETGILPLFKSFDKFRFNKISCAMNKGNEPPDHELFRICDRVAEKASMLQAEMDRHILFLKTELFRYAEKALAETKKRWNIRFFNDLLVEMGETIKGKNGSAFTGKMREKYRAALIDEFQDTDPVQYALFHALFGSEKGLIFLIGDPKQAIYGFRGADLFTYMKAAKEVTDTYTLRKNWRSEPKLIDSINTIFSRKKRPFVYEEIAYTPALAGETKEYKEYLMIDGEHQPPFRLWLIDRSKEDKPDKQLGKGRAKELILKALGYEIARLVNLGRQNRALIGDGSLREKDIAVLVRTNREAVQVQQSLSILKIPCVLSSALNLFDSHEAAETARLLEAVSEPDNEALLRGALSTDILGFTGEELERFVEEEDKWDPVIRRFREYHDLWNIRGFIPMFRNFVSREKVRTRLLAFPDGERRLTNLLHLSEVLQQESFANAPGMTGLLKWLSERIDPGTPRLEEYELRLETDEDTVKIVTVHKSKGLEYPVVFCPFAWATFQEKKEAKEITFHDKEHDFRLTLDLGSRDILEHKAFAERENLSENARLFYVALTRAKNRCYMVWGGINTAENSAPAYLFHGRSPAEPGRELIESIEYFKGLTEKELISEVKGLSDKAEGAIICSHIPDENPKPLSAPDTFKEALSCREFSGTISRDFGVLSFSSIISGSSENIGLPDHDDTTVNLIEAEANLRMMEEETLTGIFAFPRGANAGTFMHDVFEHLNFKEKDDGKIRGLVENKLDEYGFESGWMDTITDMIKNVLSTPLDPESDDLRLSCIQDKDRLTELEFYFPIKMVSPEKLMEIFRTVPGLKTEMDLPGSIERLRFVPLRGFMKGFIDLVFKWRGRFYLIDWKSNFLGSRMEDYETSRLALIMEKEFYFLQYYIYTLALDQYLRLRIPDYNYKDHFGGVYYIFLRGVSPEAGPGFGIYRDFPSPELIRRLREKVIEGSGLHI